MNYRRLLMLAVVPLITIAVSTTAAHAEGKTVQVCNRKGSVISVAIGWMDYGLPAASGWYVFNFNDCKTLSFPKADSYLPLFAYAEDVNGNSFTPSSAVSGDLKNNFCISRSSFSEKSTSLCQVRDLTTGEITSEWQGFGALGFPLSDFFRWDLR